jgi:hypothetical protein
MSPFTEISFKQFKDSANTFFDTTAENIVDVESATNGFKALTLLYFGHSDDWTADEVNEGWHLIHDAAKVLVSIERLTGTVVNEN